MPVKNLKKSTKKKAPSKNKTLKKYKVWSNIHNKYLTFKKNDKKIDIKKDKHDIVNKMSYNSEFINLLMASVISISLLDEDSHTSSALSKSSILKRDSSTSMLALVKASNAILRVMPGNN